MVHFILINQFFIIDVMIRPSPLIKWIFSWVEHCFWLIKGDVFDA
jgi:hypothetical protein